MVSLSQMTVFRAFPRAIVFLFLPLMGVAEVEVLLTTIDTDDARLAQSHLALWPLREESRSQGAVISVDRRKTFQTMLGYGGAMTDASAAVLLGLKSTDAKAYAVTME